jgi:hypothetical protein
MNNKIVNGIVTVVILIVFIKTCFNTSESESNLNSESNAENKSIENSSNVLPFPEEEMTRVREQVDYFENKLKNDFWTKFQQSNKYGKKYGPIEYTFDNNKFEEFMQSISFAKTANGTQMDYDGVRNEFQVFLNNNGSVASNSGWIIKWEIIIRKNIDNLIYEYKKEISLSK